MMETTMSDHPDPLDQQIAALESALRLPLPDATRAQIERDLRGRAGRRSPRRQGVTRYVWCELIL
jgi:hypothetical protein